MVEKSSSVVILGLDPGSRITGVGVIVLNGNEIRYLHAESVKLGTGELPDRLEKLYSRLNDIITQFRPQIMAIEKVFLAKNAQSALVLGHARGAAMLTAVNQQLSIVEYSATEVKKSVVGRGRAAKNQVQHMMRVLLGLSVMPEEDAADALAAAVCHAYHLQTQLRMQRSQNFAKVKL